MKCSLGFCVVSTSVYGSRNPLFLQVNFFKDRLGSFSKAIVGAKNLVKYQIKRCCKRLIPNGVKQTER